MRSASITTRCSPTCRCWSTSNARSSRSDVTTWRSATTARGYLPEAMVNYLALLGWGPSDGVEVRPIAEIIERFELTDVNPSPAFFDVKKLTHVNAEYLRALPVDEFVEQATPFLSGGDAAVDALRALGPLVQERVQTLAEVDPMIVVPLAGRARHRRGRLGQARGAGRSRRGDARRDAAALGGDRRRVLVARVGRGGGRRRDDRARVRQRRRSSATCEDAGPGAGGHDRPGGRSAAVGVAGPAREGAHPGAAGCRRERAT